MKRREKSKQELQDDARVREALAEPFSDGGAATGERGGRMRRAQGFTQPDELKWTTMEGDKPMKMEEEKTTSSFVYLLGGFALGAVCGLLFAPKKGSELIEDIGEWSRDQKVRGQELYSKVKEYIPHRARRAISERA